MEPGGPLTALWLFSAGLKHMDETAGNNYHLYTWIPPSNIEQYQDSLNEVSLLASSMHIEFTTAQCPGSIHRAG